MTRRLFDNIKENKRWGFFTWKKYYESIKFKDLMASEKQVYVVRNLEIFIRNKQRAHTKHAFECLQYLEREEILKRRFFSAMMRTKVGRMRVALDKWKAVPSKRALKRQQTMHGLTLLVHSLMARRKKEAFDVFKEEWYKRREIQKQCIRNMIYLTTDKTKRMFRVWHHNAKTDGYVLKCKAAMDVTKMLNGILKNEVLALFINEGDMKRKRAILR